MVYKLSNPRRGSISGLLLWACLRCGLAVTIGLFCIEHFFLASLALGHSVELAIALCGGVLASGLAYLIIMQTFRRARPRGDMFVTLTEAGIMVELPFIGEKQYQPWQRISSVRRVKNVLILQRVHGLADLLPLDNLSPARAEEMENYCREHIGKTVPPEAQIRPSGEYLSATPYKRKDSTAIRREVADALMRHVSPLSSYLVIIAVPIFIAASIQMLSIGIQDGMIRDLGLAVFTIACLFLSLRYYLHPGARMKKWIQSPEACELETHVTRGHVLLCIGSYWALVPSARVDRCMKMRHSYVYEVSQAGVFAISRDEQPPGALPQPQPVRSLRRMLLHCIVLLVLPALLLGALHLIPESELEEGQRMYREAASRGEALAAYAEALTPVRGYPGGIEQCLYYALGDGWGCLYIYWDDESSCQLMLEPPDDRE